MTANLMTTAVLTALIQPIAEPLPGGAALGPNGLLILLSVLIVVAALFAGNRRRRSRRPPLLDMSLREKSGR
jgi:hypothetical protein